jgi:hypothetical protein
MEVAAPEDGRTPAPLRLCLSENFSAAREIHAFSSCPMTQNSGFQQFLLVASATLKY